MFVIPKWCRSQDAYLPVSSTIIRDIISLRDSDLASMACFYCDFRDTGKQNRRDILTSLVIQLSARSDPCDILSCHYHAHDSGVQKPNEDDLMKCLPFPRYATSFMELYIFYHCDRLHCEQFEKGRYVSPKLRELELLPGSLWAALAGSPS